jgi:nucleoside phosphorylase
MPPTILVCFAVKEEANTFRKKILRRPGVEVLVTGMGRRNTEASITEALARSHPNIVLTAGFAGGLRPGAPLGTVFFQTSPEAGLEPVLLKAGAQRGRVICRDRVAATREEKRQLFASTGADAVEMESGVIMEACARAKIPAATVRVVLDTAEEDLPLNFNDLMNKHQRLDYVKLAWALFKSPGKIPALMRLQKQSGEAAEALAIVLMKTCEGMTKTV